MKRAFAILLCCIGLPSAFFAWLQPYPAIVGVNGRYVSLWVLVVILGIVLTAVGAAMLWRTRRS